MRLLLLAVIALSGCGVDSTRAMWRQDWTDPGHGAGHGAKRTAEVTAKVALTPGTAVVDVVTDPVTWYCLYLAGRITLECCAESCCR